MKPFARLGLLTVLATLACGDGPKGKSPDSSVADIDAGDGGNCPGCPNNEPSRPVLRPNLGLDLARVGSFFALSGSGSQAQRFSLSAEELIPQAMDGGDLDGATSDGDGGAPTSPGLYALTLSGETLGVALLEEGNPRAVGKVIAQPQIIDIWPTPAWVLFNAQLLVVYRLDADGGSEQIPCSTIAARRSDGALFCAPLLIGHGSGVVDDRFPMVQATAAGDVLFAHAGAVPAPNQGPDPSSFHVYRIELDAPDGPTATLAVDASIRANWFLTDAAGDLLVNYFPSPLDTSRSTSKLFPAGGGSALTLAGQHHSFAACGGAGAADENTFYVLNGGGGGWPFDGTIAVVARSGAAFAETSQTINLADANMYGGLYRLNDGLYMFSKGTRSIAKVIAGGTMVAAPAPIVFADVDALVDFNGMPIRQANSEVVLLGSLAGAYRFLRHDGVHQTTIPLAASIQPSRVVVSPTGAIDFWGLDTDTQQKIQGSVPAGATAATITATGALDQTLVVAFTRIN